MAHYHKSRNQQKSKWERFTRRYGMAPKDFRALKKSDSKLAHEIRIEAHKRFIASI